MAVETPGVVVGNQSDKYASGNPVVRWLTARFLGELDAVLDSVHAAGATSTLEVGAGEGVVTQRLYQRFGTAVGLDLPDAGLRAQWRGRPGPAYVHGDASRLPFADDAFDLVVAVEVLEHVPDPRAALSELARVSRAQLVLSVPRDPVFRLSNLAAGRHVRSLGNTPGHLNHWSGRDFVTLAATVGAVRAVVRPFPWTLVWIEVP